MREEETAIFSDLGSFAFNMLNLGVSGDDVRMFVVRMCNLTRLRDEQVDTMLGMSLGGVFFWLWFPLTRGGGVTLRG